MTQTPIFDSVVDEQQWSPEALRVKLDLDAMIAASYSIVARRAQTPKKARKRQARRQQQQRRTS